MSRLTQMAREAIREQLVQKAFGDRRKAQAKACPGMIEALLAGWHGKHWATVQALPREFFPVFHSLNISRRGGIHAYLQAPEGAKQWPISHELRGRYVGEDELRKRIGKDASEVVFAYLDEEKALEAEERKFRGEVMQVLNSVTTYKRLHEVWPELKDVKPPVGNENKPVESKALAPCLKSLNAALGLK